MHRMYARFRPVTVLLLASLLVIGGFAFLDFHVLDTKTSINSAVGTSQAEGTAPSQEQPLQLVVLGDGPLADAVGDGLETQLATSFPAVERVESPAEDGTGPVLVVAISESAIRYNPISPQAQVTARFGFIGEGDATLAMQPAAGESPTVLSNTHPYVVHGDLTLAGTSRGIASHPGYRGHVADGLADNLADSLLSAPGMEILTR